MAAEAEAPLLQSPSDTPRTEDMSPELGDRAAQYHAPPQDVVSDPPPYQEIYEEGVLTNPSVGPQEEVPRYEEVYHNTMATPPEFPECTVPYTETSPGPFVKPAGRAVSFWRCCTPPSPETAILMTKVLVTITLMLSGQAIFSISMINSGFLAVHFSEHRNVSGTVYGFVGSGIGIGYVLAPFLGIFYKLHYNKGFSYRSILMILLVFSLFKSVGYAFSDIVITDKNLFAAFSVIFRIISGGAGYIGCICIVNGIRTWFPDNFQLVNSLVTGASSYIGYGTSSFIGAVFYEEHGYHAPYLLLGGYIAAVSVLAYKNIPRSDTPISTFHPFVQESTGTTTTEKKLPLSDESSLSPMIALPVIAQTLVNIAGGYVVISCVPFLMSCCEMSNSRASSLILTHSFGTAGGFIIAGVISERRLVSVNVQSIIGSLIVALGVISMYPSPSITFLFSSTEYISYFAITLIGIGDPLVTGVTITNMETVQKVLYNRELTDEQRSKIASFWLIGWEVGIYSGMFLAGFLLDYLTYQQGALVIAGISLVATAIFGVLKLQYLYKKRLGGRNVRPMALSLSLIPDHAGYV